MQTTFGWQQDKSHNISVLTKQFKFLSLSSATSFCISLLGCTHSNNIGLTATEHHKTEVIVSIHSAVGTNKEVLRILEVLEDSYLNHNVK